MLSYVYSHTLHTYVMTQPMPGDTARRLTAAGAEAIIMPTRLLDDTEKRRAMACFYTELAQGTSPALAVAEANAECADLLLVCVL